jgi:hypothetical protein
MAGHTTSAERCTLTAAIDLGWRVGELYALADDLNEPVEDTLLPGHQSLSKEDQLELQVRAVAGDARRVGVEAIAAGFERLLPLARESPHSRESLEAFRRELRGCHIALEKELWAGTEAAGKAYELGTGLSDTYNRVCRAYRSGSAAGRRAEWKRVFDRRRIENLKKLLDDLQSRLDRSGVTVVSEHLDRWADSVPGRVAGDEELPGLEKVRQGLRRQTIIWRQLLAGEKEPEAYLDREQRAQLRDELRALALSSYRRFVPALVVGLGALALVAIHFDAIASWYRENIAASGAATPLFGLAGALGITRASVGLTLRSRLHEWSELRWNRALAKKITDATLTLGEVFPEPDQDRLAELVATVRVGVKPAAIGEPAAGHPA